MDLQERLVAILNHMRRIETHGDSTLYMADCIRELSVLIDILQNEPREQHKEE